ncbi:MAG: S-adenosylmethionine:tRNA ribosyltransferase-isomerase [Bacteroides sp.]|nr:S-adenosylmethionine:tRNA ribosyltransferase-isomerase [Bacteroides sp.]
MTRDIRIADFDYNLPEDNIAKHPLAERDKCKLLVADQAANSSTGVFADLAHLLDEDTLLVANNAKVINARIKFKKPTGAEIEIFLLDPVEPSDYARMFSATFPVEWSCLVGNSKRWKSDNLIKQITIDGKTITLKAERNSSTDKNIRFSWNNPDVTFAQAIEAAGFIPIPPYLNRNSEASDKVDYQTVYSQVEGSVAAPTAGLHFTPSLLTKLKNRGIEPQFVTLHVGAGTFAPVKSETIADHPMHSEAFSVSIQFLRNLRDAIAKGQPVTAVGTTSVRTLESLPYFGRMAMQSGSISDLSQWEAYDHPLDRTPTANLIDALISYLDKNGLDELTAQTAIMIAPGFKWRIVNSIITNFHQPQSTLLLLISSFLEPSNPHPQLWRQLYQKALEEDFRFLSYGDACFFQQNS